MIVRGLVRLPRLRLLAPSAVPATSIRWNSCGKSYNGERQGGGRDNRTPFWGSTAVALGLGAVLLHHSQKGMLVAEEESNEKTAGVVLGERKEGLPEFSMEEVGTSLIVECIEYIVNVLHTLNAILLTGW